MECQSYRLTNEDAPTIEYITRHMAGIQQRYTQAGGVRPYGISLLVCGFDTAAADAKPHVFLTDPSGQFSEWKANVVGRNSKTIREFLEKSWAPDLERSAAEKLAVRSMMETVEASHVEMAVMRAGQPLEFLPRERIDELVAQVEREAEEAS